MSHIGRQPEQYRPESVPKQATTLYTKQVQNDFFQQIMANFLDLLILIHTFALSDPPPS